MPKYRVQWKERVLNTFEIEVWARNIDEAETKAFQKATADDKIDSDCLDTWIEEVERLKTKTRKQDVRSR